METHLKPGNDGGVRVSDSRRCSPQVTHPMSSTVHSTHPEMQLESIDSQADFGLRTVDFFDDSTSEEEVTGILDSERQDLDFLDNDRQGSPTRATPKRRSKPLPIEPVTQCEPRGQSLQPEGDGYLRLSPVRNGQLENLRSFVDMPSSSYNGSVDELFPDEQPSSPPSLPRAARLSALRQPRDSTIMPRSEPAIRSSSVIPTPERQNVDKVLVHAIAHEITLAALMRDHTVLSQAAQGFNPIDRSSLLPASLRIQAPGTGTDDPRSPGTIRKFSTAPASHTSTIDTTVAVAKSSKKVQVVPPSIDTTVPLHHLPSDLVRTPYPSSTTIRNGNRQKHFSRQPTPSELHQTPITPHAPAETLLTLSIRRRNPCSLSRVTTLMISSPDPPLPDDIKTNISLQKAFDDMAFSLGLRSAYARLTGPYRYLSARTLQRVTVCGPSSLAAEKGYRWLHQPRSPREFAHKGLSDTFGEDKIFALFCTPKLGKGRYAFVWWGRRLAAAEAEGAAFLRAEGFAMQGMGRSTLGTPGLGNGEQTTDLIRRLEQPEGLEFVLGWSWKRILAVLTLVIVLSLAAMLLWIFLGKDSQVVTDAGFRGAGDRVAAGAVMGICMLALGLSGLVGWLGFSWLVM